MKAILDRPVIAHGSGERLGAHLARGDVVACFHRRGFALDHSHRIDPSEHRTIDPGGRIHLPSIGQGAHDLKHMPAMTGLDRVMHLVPVPDEGPFQRFVQRGLVALDRQQVVRAEGADGAGDLALGAHGIDADQTAPDRQGLQQCRDGRYFVALVGDSLLAQGNPQAGGKRADHVHGTVPSRGRSSQCLAIDGHVLAQGANHARDPAPEHLLELLGVENAKDPIERVVGGDAVLKAQEASEPRLLLARPFGHVLKTFHVRKDGADGNHQHLHQFMALAVAPSLVLDLGKVFHQACRLSRGHFRSRKRRA